MIRKRRISPSAFAIGLGRTAPSRAAADLPDLSSPYWKKISVFQKRKSAV
jgi:hypothetical protein